MTKPFANIKATQNDLTVEFILNSTIKFSKKNEYGVAHYLVVVEASLIFLYKFRFYDFIIVS